MRYIKYEREAEERKLCQGKAAFHVLYKQNGKDDNDGGMHTLHISLW